MKVNENGYDADGRGSPVAKQEPVTRARTLSPVGNRPSIDHHMDEFIVSILDLQIFEMY
jgi:hypothetical protein